MVDIEFQEAAVEVLDILNHMKIEDVDRIPIKFKELLKKNASTTYESHIDYTKSIGEAILKPKTYDLLGVIYINYWANEEEKNIFTRKINQNEEKYQEELRKKYNPDNIFNNKAREVEEINTNEVNLVEYKETIFRKIINKIKDILKKIKDVD